MNRTQMPQLCQVYSWMPPPGDPAKDLSKQISARTAIHDYTHFQTIGIFQFHLFENIQQVRAVDLLLWVWEMNRSIIYSGLVCLECTPREWIHISLAFTALASMRWICKLCCTLLSSTALSMHYMPKHLSSKWQKLISQRLGFKTGAGMISARNVAIQCCTCGSALGVRNLTRVHRSTKILNLERFC